MELPRIILAATDFSHCGGEAVATGVQLAKRLDAQLYVMHAWTTPISNWDGGLGVPTEIVMQLETTARTLLDKALADVRKELPNALGTFIRSDPRAAILDAARETRAELVIIGTHGRTGLARLLLGSVAEYVVRHSPCPVLTVRAASV